MNPPHDALAGLIDPEGQKEAAQLAEDAFGRIFRLIVEGDEVAAEVGLSVIESRARDWAQKDVDPERATLRLALLVSGLDQWGLAWTQAFDLVSLPGLPRLLGNLRGALDIQSCARFESQFAAIEAREENAIDFKMTLRRGIHLAIWHAIAASDDDEERDDLIRRLGSQMLALNQQMPEWGGHVLADTLAHIQLRLLQATARNERAETATQRLFGSLSQSLTEERSRNILAQAAQLTAAYQAAQRKAAETMEVQAQ